MMPHRPDAHRARGRVPIGTGLLVLVLLLSGGAARPSGQEAVPAAVSPQPAGMSGPQLLSISPSPLRVGFNEVTFEGSNFTPGSYIVANGTPIPVVFVSPNRLMVSGVIPAPMTVEVSVRQPGGATSNSLLVQILSGDPAGPMPPPGPMDPMPPTGPSPAPPASPGPTAPGAPQPPGAGGRLSAARFLEQASFGPTPAGIARVQQIGIEAYLDEQFDLPETELQSAGNSMSAFRQSMLHHYTTAPDQLRQRVAYALSQIIVASANKLNYPNEILPWLRLLGRHAFGSYRDLLREVTISPSMGKYLDLANSNKPGMSGGANENYPRELMQLFTIGMARLNGDGTPVMGSDGQPEPAFDQDTVRQVALALTGWTYATAPGAAPRANNWEYFGAPMEPRPNNHATGAKSFLGCQLPAGQSVEQDLDGVIDCLMGHPNTGPFVATRLIRSLVTSNPSPGYVGRVAGVFSATRGDLRAVVRAILLDGEARHDSAPPTGGRLKEPILQAAGLVRALNGHFNRNQGLTYLFEYMAQGILNPPSVFSWFSPLYRIPRKPLFGPEFQIYGPSEAALRGNLLYSLLSNPSSDVTIDLSPFLAHGDDMPALVDAVDQALLYGRMPAAMKQALVSAASPGYDARTRVLTVLYLTALSGQYAVQH